MSGVSSDVGRWSSRGEGGPLIGKKKEVKKQERLCGGNNSGIELHENELGREPAWGWEHCAQESPGIRQGYCRDKRMCGVNSSDGDMDAMQG